LLDQIRDLISPKFGPRFGERLYQRQRIMLEGPRDFGSLTIRNPTCDPSPKSVERTP